MSSAFGRASPQPRAQDGTHVLDSGPLASAWSAAGRACGDETLHLAVDRIAGVKDVVLPQDLRELLNKVVEAERVARANLIHRQEEAAAPRSLLNTIASEGGQSTPLGSQGSRSPGEARREGRSHRLDTGRSDSGPDALLQIL